MLNDFSEHISCRSDESSSFVLFKAIWWKENSKDLLFMAYLLMLWICISLTISSTRSVRDYMLMFEQARFMTSFMNSPHIFLWAEPIWADRAQIMHTCRPKNYIEQRAQARLELKISKHWLTSEEWIFSWSIKEM